MKKYTNLINFLTFFLIFFFYVIPPLIFKPVPADKINFPLNSSICFIFSVFFYFFCKKFLFSDSTKEKTSIKTPVKILIFFLTLIFLFLCGIFFNFLATKFSYTDDFLIIPETKTDFFYIIINFLFSAFFEEIIYRFYLPEQVFLFIKLKLNEKFSFIFAEILALLIFAFSHRYRGIFAILNAGFGYAILRFCYKKTDNIFITTAAHFVYNILIFFLSIS